MEFSFPSQRANTSAYTLVAPASLQARAQSRSVAPVVITSSTRSIRPPAISGEAAKAPLAFSSRPNRVRLD